MRGWCNTCQRGNHDTDDNGKCHDCGNELRAKVKGTEVKKDIALGGGYAADISYDVKDSYLAEPLDPGASEELEEAPLPKKKVMSEETKAKIRATKARKKAEAPRARNPDIFILRLWQMIIS